MPVDRDEEALHEHADRLVGAVESAVPGWITLCVTTRARQAGIDLDDEARLATEKAASRAAGEVASELRELLATDIDAQRGSPLEILRRAVRHPTAVLRQVGVAPVVRDDFSRREFPDDDYALTPGSFADVDETLHEPAIAWGAAKAHVHLTRRRAEGLR